MKVSILLLIVVLATSCGYYKYDVKLSNGAIVKAVDYEDRGRYALGEKVCIVKTSLSGEWTIESTGVMTDTSYLRPIIRKYENSSVPDTLYPVVEYRTGIIHYIRR